MGKRTTHDLRKRRHYRIRKRIKGDSSRLRLNVFRSNLHIYAQVIDDTVGHTLVAASTAEKTLRSEERSGNGSKVAQAQAVGKLIAERALQAGVTKVVFDRGGYRYHGRVKALAEAAREAGLSF
jgi:large subunit ribosomal protein L18